MSITPVISTSLFYKDAGSDKVYNASIVPAQDGTYLVNFSYGRRGSTLTSGTKTQTGVPLAKARIIYDKLIGEKTSKGYTPQDGGQLFSDTDKAGEVSGYVPQLLNALDANEMSLLIKNNDYVAQEKHDGRRVIAGKVDGSVFGANRKGLLISLPQELADKINFLLNNTVLDGELIGTVYYVFDVLQWNGYDLRGESYEYRLKKLQCIEESAYIKRVKTAMGTTEKTTLLHRVQAERGEGIVFKYLFAPYRAGRPSSGGHQRKYKFVESVTVQVVSISTNKRSVAVAVRDINDNLCHVGNVTVLPNFPVPAVGALVEVEYLYYYEGGSLYQPIYKGERDDLSAPDALLTLKRKQSVDEEE